MIFIRFHGCNLECSFCDEKKNDFKPYDLKEIIKEIRSFPCRNVLLTGGEPLLQKNIPFLIEQFIHSGYQVYIESNGTLPLSLSDLIRQKVWITVSPKNNQIILEANEYKFLYDEFTPSIQVLWQRISTRLSSWRTKSAHLYLQPVYYKDQQEKTKMNLEQAIEIVKSHAGLLRLSFQAHKYLEIQ